MAMETRALLAAHVAPYDEAHPFNRDAYSYPSAGALCGRMLGRGVSGRLGLGYTSHGAVRSQRLGCLMCMALNSPISRRTRLG